ncbi:hypothetical protein NDA16_002623 [Ustilago loliicola]|nr:hypothetical protein NDA16_002623 [Ustilago loliicola]
MRKRAPSPSPAPAPAPAPTTPPTRRNPHEPEHRVVPADEFNRRLLENEESAEKREEILGPFWARDMDQVVQIKCDVLRRRAKRQLADEPKVQPRSAQQSRIQRRQTAAEETCFVGNEDLSCYPNAGTTIAQNTWSKFIWNANYPLFAQRGFVDVYLFQQDTDRLVTSWISQDNGAGRVSFEPTDSWWANRPAANNIQPNQNISWPFYFVVLASGQPLSGTTSRLATFTAVQTTLPFSIAAARASSSSVAAAASASSASAASASAQSASASASTATVTPTGSAAAASAVQSSLSAALESSLRASGLSGTETLAGTSTATLPNGSTITATATAQANGGRLGGSANSGNSNGLALPTYAIVLIAVLGFLAIAAAIAGAYFIMAALRRRRQRQSGDGSHRSSSPMMAAAAGSLAGHGTNDAGYGAGETSHMLEAEDGGGASMYPAAGAAGIGAAGGAAMMASNSKSSRFSEEQPFTSDEASRMADAFRNALRNPEFAPGMGGESSGADGESPNEGGTSRASALLREELAAEGKDLRDVGDRKKPTWHEE